MKMDAEKKPDEYRQFSNEQLFQLGKITAPIGVIVLSYFIFSDIYLRDVPAWALTRILPLLFLLAFFIASLTKTAEKRPTALIVIYNLAWFSLVGMSYSIAIIAWNMDTYLRLTSVTGLIVVCIAVFMAMRGSVINVVLIYLVPSLIFVTYIIVFIDDPRKLADFSNSFTVILAAIIIYGYDERLRRSKFLAESDLLLANKKMSLLARELSDQNGKLQKALKEVQQLSGMLPICVNCKKIRDDQEYWHDVDIYIRDHSEAEFSHGICPDCARELYPKYFRDTRKKGL